MPPENEDQVNSPSHYTQGGRECIDEIRDVLGPVGFTAFCLGNAMKYQYRAGLKGPAHVDLAKALWYERMATGDDPRKDGREQFRSRLAAPPENNAEILEAEKEIVEKFTQTVTVPAKNAAILRAAIAFSAALEAYEASVAEWDLLIAAIGRGQETRAAESKWQALGGRVVAAQNLLKRAVNAPQAEKP